MIGGLANITKEYATKRYRSNVMNWGMIPFHLKGEPVDFEVGDYIYVPGIREALDGDLSDIKGYVIKDGNAAGAASAETPIISSPAASWPRAGSRTAEAGIIWMTPA